MKVKPYFLSACKGIPFRILYISSFLIVIIFLSSNTVHDVVRDPLIESTHVSAETLTIKLSKPLHRFHSDHWFHIAEYYLINNDKIICTNSKSTEDIIEGKHKSAIICPGPSAVVIVAPEDPKFLKKLTKVTFFLLLLSFTDENISTALVVNHDFISQPHISRTVFGNIVSLRYLRWIHFLPPPVVFLQYDIMKPINERFLAPSELTHKFFSENVKTLSPMNSFNTGDIPNNSDRWFTSKDQVRRFRSKIHHLCDCPTSMTRPSQLEARSDTAASQTPCSPNSQSLLIRAAHPNILVSRKLNGIFLSLPLAVVRPLKVQPKIRGIRRYRMVIYERNSNRRFSDLEETLELLSKYTDNQTDTITGEIIFWDIDVIYHSDDMNPCLLDVALRSANILITTHGFQSTGTLSSLCICMKYFLPAQIFDVMQRFFHVF